MKNNLDNKGIIKFEKKPEIIEAECQNCGKKIIVIAPYYGCIFCEECRRFETYETADAPEFKQKINYTK